MSPSIAEHFSTLKDHRIEAKNLELMTLLRLKSVMDLLTQKVSLFITLKLVSIVLGAIVNKLRRIL